MESLIAASKVEFGDMPSSIVYYNDALSATSAIEATSPIIVGESK